MALNLNHTVNNNWRRGALAPVSRALNPASRSAGGFNNNLINNLNKLPSSPAVSVLKPPVRGLSPAAASAGQKSSGELKPPASMAYANLISGSSYEKEGLTQVNRTVNRAAGRGQFIGINNKNVVSSSNRGSLLKTQNQAHYEQLAEAAAVRHGVDPNLVKAVINAESGYLPQVVSQAGAMGLMQLMPGTASDMQVKNTFDPAENIEGGTKYLAWLSGQFDGDENKILAAYNWGPGNVRRGGSLPAETRNYLVKVKQYKQEYQEMAERESESRQARLTAKVV